MSSLQISAGFVLVMASLAYVAFVAHYYSSFVKMNLDSCLGKFN